MDCPWFTVHCCPQRFHRFTTEIVGTFEFYRVASRFCDVFHFLAAAAVVEQFNVRIRAVRDCREQKPSHTCAIGEIQKVGLRALCLLDSSLPVLLQQFVTPAQQASASVWLAAYVTRFRHTRDLILPSRELHGHSASN